ncbi:MAG: DUF2079 domain-containing protein [Deltaproteobacteria bacterium]|nr:MAG: DUF2079 domain-containing protein [Deltaproteobacteria bacterium]
MVAAADFAWRRISIAIWIWLAPVVAIWPLFHRKAIDYLVENELPHDERVALARWCAGAVAVGLAGYVAWALARGVPGRGRFDRAFADLNRRLAPLLAAPFASLLVVPKVEKEHPFWTWIAIFAVVAACGVLVRRGLARIDEVTLERAARRTVPVAIAVGLGAGVIYGWKVSNLALAHHVHMRTQIYDLGIYDNVVWNTTFGEFLRCSFIKGGNHTAAHFDPVLYLLTPAYRLAPRAETLLVAQSVWVATGVVPLLLLGRKLHGSWWVGATMAVLYGLYPALHGANLFDFHSITLAIPTILWVVYLVDTQATWLYVPAWLLLLATREDMSLLACFIGFYAIWARKRPWLGLSTIAVSLAYLVAVKRFVMPDPGLLMKASRTTYSYIYFYADMIPHADEGARGLVLSFFTNPVFVLQHVLSEEKVAYLLAILGPLCGLPLLSKRRYPLYLYGALFILLSSRHHMYSIHFQYNAVVVPFVIAGWADGLAWLRNRYASFGRRRVAVLGTTVSLVATLLAGAKFGILAENKSFRAGWEPLLRDVPENVLERYAWFYHKVRELVPPDVPLSASSRLGPHVSNRPDVYRFPVIRDAEFVMVFSKDMGKKEKAALERMKRRRRFELVAKKHGIEIYRRKAKGPAPKKKPTKLPVLPKTPSPDAASPTAPRAAEAGDPAKD